MTTEEAHQKKLAYDREYRKRNKEKIAAYKDKWRRDNKDTWSAYWRNFRQKLKLQVMEHYGNGKVACACCGESMIEFLTLDHIDNDGAEHRRNEVKGALKDGRGSRAGGWKFYHWLKKNDYPAEYRLQILCWNCNCAKGFYKVCPHVERPALSETMVKVK